MDLHGVAAAAVDTVAALVNASLVTNLLRPIDGGDDDNDTYAAEPSNRYWYYHYYPLQVQCMVRKLHTVGEFCKEVVAWQNFECDDIGTDDEDANVEYDEKVDGMDAALVMLGHEQTEMLCWE